MKHTLRSRSLALGALALAGVLAGCRGQRDDQPPREFFPDMDDMLRWNVQVQTDFYKDGRSMRQPVAGTVAFARLSLGEAALAERPAWATSFLHQRDQLLGEDREVYTGMSGPGAFVADIPGGVVVDRALVERGRAKFNIYCATCHGFDGAGTGMVGRQWSYPLPNFHDPKYKDPAQKTGLDGYLFSTARNGFFGPDGVQKMPGYGHALDETDAWGVVAYIRTLQGAYEGTALVAPPAAPAGQASPASKSGGKP